MLFLTIPAGSENIATEKSHHEEHGFEIGCNDLF